jgi:hypothetical protein
MRSPLFLARTVYRRRRLRDAARILPFAGLFLLLLPALGQHGPGEGRKAVYIFIVWGLLIAAAAVLSPSLSQPESDTATPPEDDDAL